MGCPSRSARSCSRSRLTATKDVPAGRIDKKIPDGLIDPREVVGHRLPQPDRVPKLLGLDAGDDLPGLIDQGVQLGIAADVQPPEPVEELRGVRDGGIPEDLWLAVLEPRERGCW